MMSEELMRQRRDFLKLAFAGALTGVGPTLASAAEAADAPAAAAPTDRKSVV